MAETQDVESKNATEINKRIKEVTSQSKTMSNVYENIVDFPIGTSSNEIVNILNDYYWTINKSQGTNSTFSGQIPFIYVSERRQLFSSQITNVINSIMSLNNASGKIGESAEQIENAIANIARAFVDMDNDDTKSTEEAKKDTPKQPESKPETKSEDGASTTEKQQQQSGQPQNGQPQNNTSGTPADGQQTQGADGQPTTTPQSQTPQTPQKTKTAEELKKEQEQKQKEADQAAAKKREERANQMAEDAKNKVKKTLNTGTAAISSMSAFLAKMSLDIANIYESSHIKGSLLYPYMYLYATKATGKNYVFPCLTDDAAKFMISNSFSDSASSTNNQTNLLNNGLLHELTNFPQMVSGVLNDLLQLTSFLGGDSSGKNFNNNWVEMGKFYNYSPDGDDVTVTFPLFNTVKKDAWKQNHKFCFAFAVRNMPFKIDNTSYKMPLLYDVMIPGVRRLPFAYVSNMNITPRGIVRPIKGENYLKKILQERELKEGDEMILRDEDQNIPNEIVYNIPEAWMVSITFKDLVGASANKLLAQLSNNVITAKVEQST